MSGGAAEAGGPGGGPPLPLRFNLAAALLERRLEAGDGRRVALECPDDGLDRAWPLSVDAAPTALAAADTHRDAPAFWPWTSGSTGTRKAAGHLHQDWPWCCEGFGVGVLGRSPRDRIYSAAKLGGRRGAAGVRPGAAGALQVSADD